MAKNNKQVLKTEVYVQISKDDNHLIKIKDNSNDTKSLKLSDDGINFLAKLFASNVLKTDAVRGEKF